jgi:hypothetical protein
MFLSQSTDFLDILYYDMDASPFSSVLFYYVLSLVVILMVMLIVPMAKVMIVHSCRVHYLQSFIMWNKLWSTKETARERDEDSKVTAKLCWLYIYYIILNRKVFYKSYSSCGQNRLHAEHWEFRTHCSYSRW